MKIHRDISNELNPNPAEEDETGIGLCGWLLTSLSLGSDHFIFYIIFYYIYIICYYVYLIFTLYFIIFTLYFYGSSPPSP